MDEAALVGGVTRDQMEDTVVKEGCEVCRYEMAYSVQFANLGEDMRELKSRVERLETTLGRGVMLLVANLVGVVMMLVQQLWQA